MVATGCCWGGLMIVVEMLVRSVFLELGKYGYMHTERVGMEQDPKRC